MNNELEKKGDGERTKKELFCNKKSFISSLLLSLVPILVAAESFACESIIDALTIIENQCSIKTPLVLLQSATVAITNITSANFPIITLLKKRLSSAISFEALLKYGC